MKPDQAFAIDGLFLAVRVTTRLRATWSTKAVHSVDDTSIVDVDYASPVSKV